MLKTYLHICFDIIWFLNYESLIKELKRTFLAVSVFPPLRTITHVRSECIDTCSIVFTWCCLAFLHIYKKSDTFCQAFWIQYKLFRTTLFIEKKNVLKITFVTIFTLPALCTFTVIRTVAIDACPIILTRFKQITLIHIWTKNAEKDVELKC